MALTVPRLRIQSKGQLPLKHTAVRTHTREREREPTNMVKVGNQECAISLAPGPIAELAAELRNKAAN